MSNNLTSFTLQHDGKDCGVACLLSIIRYYEGDSTFEKLREISGTSLEGTSLLGLYQAAESLGFKAEAFEVEDLETFKTNAIFPAILHVLIDNRLEHFVVCYGFDSIKDIYIIGDPSIGIINWSETTLLDNWQSKSLLMLSPTDSFIQTQQNKRHQWLWFQELINDELPLLGLAGTLGVILAIIGVFTAYFSQRLIDNFLPNHDSVSLITGLFILGVVLLLRTVLGYLRTFILLRQSRDFNSRIANRFYESLLRLPQFFFDTRKTGELMARMNDTRRIQSTVSYLVGNIMIDCLVIIGSLIFIFIYSTKIAVIALISLPLFCWLVWKFNHKIIMQQKKTMSSYAKTESNYVDTITGISTIKATRTELYFIKTTQNTYNSFQQSIYDLGQLSNQYNLIGDFFNQFLLFSILIGCSFLIFEKQLKIGEMTAILTVSSSLFMAISKLATTNIQLQEAKVAFERMYEFASISPEIIQSNNDIVQKWGGDKIIDYQPFKFSICRKKSIIERCFVVGQ